MKDLTKLKNDCLFQGRLRKFEKTHFEKETNEITGKYELAITNNQKFPDKNDFNSVWSELKGLYFERQDGRCCICEKELNDIYSQDIEHYRPKSHYWWLAYNTENYYLCCAECNRSYKKEKFPLANNQNKTTYTNRKEIESEKPLLLNPMNDNPNDYFQLVFIIHSTTNKGIAILQSKSDLNTFLKKRADKTIEIYNLDLHSYRTDTDKSRFNLLNKYYNDLFEIAKAKKLKSDKEFKGTLLQKVKERPELKTLDLLKLIINNQVIINTLTN